MTHPLEDYLAAAGESPSAFAARLGVDADAIVRILGGGAPASPVLARRIVEAGKPGGGYVFNTGEGIPRQTDPAVVETMVQTAKRCGGY
ncbi:MAG: hypothetical protein Kow00133_20250 [Amphiplicatus sp.]